MLLLFKNSSPKPKMCLWDNSQGLPDQKVKAWDNSQSFPDKKVKAWDNSQSPAGEKENHGTTPTASLIKKKEPWDNSHSSVIQEIKSLLFNLFAWKSRAESQGAGSVNVKHIDFHVVLSNIGKMPPDAGFAHLCISSPAAFHPVA